MRTQKTPVITITRQHIEELKTPAGGFNQAAMGIIGEWPLTTGWQDRLIGTQIADRKWRSAVNAAKRGKKHYFRGNTRRR